MSKLRIKRSLALLTVVAMVMTLFAGVTFAQEDDPVTRLSGADRYETAAAIAEEAYPNGADAVVIANGEAAFGYADGLASSALAGELGAPVLLTKADELPAVTAEAIGNLEAAEAVVLGGTTAVSAAVVDALEDLGLTVERIAGEDRYGTAAAIAAELGEGPAVAFIVNGTAPADSLVVGPLAALNGVPILQVKVDEVPAVTAEAIADRGIVDLIIIGGTAVVSEAVKTELEGLVDGEVIRVAGADRYETCVEVAQTFFASPQNVIFAGGANARLVDAIAGGYLGAILEAPILYTTSLPEVVEDYLDSIVGENTRAFVLGGTAAVSDEVADTVGEKIESAVPEELEVIGVSAIEDINVANGTAKADIGLPAEVTITLSDESTATVPVTWDDGTPAYDAATAGTYAFAGTLDLSGLENVAATELKAAVNVVVAEAVLAVESVSAINATTLNGATDVNPGTTITVTFNKDVDATTVSADDFTLVTGSTQVPFSVAVDSDNKKEVVITPTSALNVNTDYTFTVGTGIKDTDGNSLAAGATATFKTGNQLVLTQVRFIDNGANSDIITGDAYNRVDFLAADDIRFTFNVNLDAATVNTTNVKLYNVTDSQYVALDGANMFNAANANRIDVSPANNLSTEKQYKITITGIKGLAGNSLVEDIELNVNIGAAPAIQAGTATPADASTDINPNLVETTNVDPLEISFRFARNVDASTVNTDNVQLWSINALNEKLEKVTGTVSYDALTRTVTFVPAQALADETRYGLYVGTGIKSSFGISPDDELTVTTFTTGDYTSPAVESVTPSNLNNINHETTDLVIKFTEEIDVAGLTVTAAAPADQTAANAESIYLMDVTDNDFKQINTALTWNSDNDELTVDLNDATAALEYSHSYKLVLTGVDNVDYGDPIRDTAAAGALHAVGNGFQTYEINFTTAAASGPTVSKILIDDGDAIFELTDAEIAKGAVDVRFDRNLFIVFNKIVDHNSGGIPDDPGADLDGIAFSSNTAQTPDGNVVLERYDFANNEWDGVDLTNATAATINDVIAATGSFSYVTIDAGDIDANGRYRIRVLAAGVGANNVVEDANNNEMEDDYVFSFFTTGTGPAVVTADPAAAYVNTTVNEPTGLAKGATAINADAAEPADNSWIAIELSDGNVHITKIANGAGGANVWEFEDSTPGIVEDEARITTVPTVWRYVTNVEVDKPLIIVINGNDADAAADVTGNGEVDLDTVTTETIKLQDANGNDVAATILAKKLGDPSGDVNDNVDAIIAIKPDANLAENANYKIVVSGVKDKLGNLVDDTTLPFSTEDVENDLAVESCTIANDQVDVATGAKIEIKFNEAIANVTDGTPIVNVAGATGADGTSRVALADDATDTAVGGTVEVSADGKTITILVDGYLAVDTVYNLVIDGSVATATVTNTLGQDYEVTFRTETTSSAAITEAKLYDIDGDGTTSAGDVLRLTFNTQSLANTNLDHQDDFTVTGPGSTIANQTNITVNDNIVDITLGAGDSITPGLSTIAVDNVDTGGLTNATFTTQEVTITK